MWRSSRLTLNSTDGSSVSEKSSLIPGFARQRHLFRSLLNKIEGLSELSCLQRPGFRLLADLAREARDTARRTDRELAQGADPLHPHVPQPERIEQLIEHTSDLQDRLQRQLALAAQWQEDADELQHELELLVGRRQMVSQGLSFDGVRALARRLISELLYDVTPPVLHPQVALDLLSERLANQGQTQVFAVALASAQLVARVARVTWLREDHVELVTAAALLQDCGKLLVQASLDRASTTGDRPLTQHRHARIGAAVVSRYRNAPEELATLIAEHHQRIRPVQDLANPVVPEQSQFSRLLAAASRFERLRVNLADRSTLISPPELIDRPAMSQLWREAVAGQWDMSLVRKILIQRDGYQECMTTSDTPVMNRSRIVQLAHS